MVFCYPRYITMSLKVAKMPQLTRKICKLCKVRFRGTSAPEEVHCAKCYVITCEVPEDTDEQFLKLLSEMSGQDMILPKRRLGTSSVRKTTAIKSEAAVKKGSSNATVTTPPSKTRKTRDLQTSSDNNKDAPQRRLEAVSLKRTTERKGSSTVTFKMPSKWKPQKPEVNNNTPVTASSSSEEEDGKNENDRENRGTVSSGLSRSNSVRDRIKAFEEIQRSASTGSFDRKRRPVRRRENDKKGSTTVIKPDAVVEKDSSNATFTPPTPERKELQVNRNNNIDDAPPQRRLEAVSLKRTTEKKDNSTTVTFKMPSKWKPREPEVNNNTPVTASSSSEEEGDKAENDRENRGASGLTRSNSVRDRIKAFEEIQRSASTGSFDRKRRPTRIKVIHCDLNSIPSP